jgi:hypothetical protein
MYHPIWLINYSILIKYLSLSHLIIVLGSYQCHFLSRKSLTASQNEAKEKWKGKYSNREQMPPPPPL